MQTHVLPKAGLPARTLATAALIGAAAIHASVAGEHYDEWATAGQFFAALTLIEGFLAVAVVVAWSRLTALAIVVSSVGTVAVWLDSRIFGIPVGPAAHRVPEAVGLPDLMCVALELLAAAAVITTAVGAARIATITGPPARRTLLRAAGAVAASVLITGVGLNPAANAHESHSHVAPVPVTPGGGPRIGLNH